MVGKFLEKLRAWLSRPSGKSARVRPGAVGLELDIARGVVHRVRVHPFAMRPESRRCIPSRTRE